MSYFVFRPQSTTGGRELADALGGSRLRRFENGRFFRLREQGRGTPVNVRQNDVVIMWGAHIPGVPAGVRTLNNVPLHSKFEDAEILRRAGVPTVEVSRTRPNGQAAAPAADPAVGVHQQVQALLEDFIETPFTRNEVYGRGVRDVTTAMQRLEAALRVAVPAAPVRPAEGWVGRTNNHTGGADLLAPPATPDYWVKKVEIVKEFRVHSFVGLSIRAGEKKHRPGFANPNPWIRSYDGGWFIDYTEFKSKQAMREIADRAVKALDLDFGAVDIGQLRDKSFIVLEVNRAPGSEAGTAQAYATAVERWSQGNWQARPAAPRQGRQARRAA